MRVLLIDAFAPDDPDRRNADSAAEVLAATGHDVRRVDVVADGFATCMSAAERRVYHDEGANILADEVWPPMIGPSVARATSAISLRTPRAPNY